MIAAHKVLAAYAVLAPRIVTGQFDPIEQRAIWPSTGNYCRGGVAISRIMGCRVLAGTWAGVTGPARTPAQIAYAHLELDAGARFLHAVPEGWIAAVVPLRGSVRIEGTEVPADTVALLAEGNALALEADAPVSLMLLAGEPLREPIAHYGPFVMNTREEIERAVLDYQTGRMGRLN
jgi:redox-sensitive bicupin YhaK (pirin superfamily)